MVVNSIAQFVSLTLVVLGVSVVGTQSTWRETIVGLGLQYFGIAGLLAVTASLSSAIVEAVVATGVLLILSNNGYFAGAYQPEPGALPRPNRYRSGVVARGNPTSANPIHVTGRQIVANLLARPFDASVVALAVVGAIALALTRPLFGTLAVDGSIDVLIISSILGCLLGGETRVAGGLFFLFSAAGLALHAGNSSPAPSEAILLALAQVSLALVLIYLRALRVEPAGRLAATGAPPDKSEATVAPVRSVASVASIASHQVTSAELPANASVDPAIES